MFHLTFGNYKILEAYDTNEKFAFELTHVLKSALNGFIEPICPYDVFDYHLMTEIKVFKNDT